MQEQRNNRYIYKATLVAAVGGLLFGYDTAVIAGATVEPGKGALVRASSTGSPLGPVFIIDQSGRKFAITDPSDETLARLGYAGLRPAVVPAPWLLVFPSGPALNEQAALAAPTAGGGGP